jgi:cyanophycinase
VSRRRVILALLAVFAAACAAEPAPVTTGPAQGTLLIVGGGNMQKLWPVFLDLAGGVGAPIVVIPTASEKVDGDEPATTALRASGAQRVVQLHTRDRAVADSEAFVRPLREARAVWFSGGRQWRLVDSYLRTRTQHEIEALLARGGVVGGSSAGATIQGSYLVRGSPLNNRIMMSPGHEEGFALLKNSAIDQHVNTQGRGDDLRPVLRRHRHLLGIGLDEATALVVQGNTCRVLGAGNVRFFAAADDEPTVLTDGGRYDLAARRVLPGKAAN